MPIISNVPYNIRSKRQILDAIADTPHLAVNGTKVVTANSTAAIPAIADRSNQVVRAIQNCGAFPVKWAIGSVPAVDSFHGILAACAVADDGTSPILDLSAVRGSIFILGVGGNPRVATFEAFRAS